jgi:hypothetical protein
VTGVQERRRSHPCGEEHLTVPIAPIEDAMIRVPAGPVTFGIERRVINEAVLQTHYEQHEQVDMVVGLLEDAGLTAAEVDDQGMSIHVFDTETGAEYLRFDGFDDDPHYHYIKPGRSHIVVGFDDDADPDFFGWVFRALRARLAPMLRRSGATELADGLDPDAVASALDEVVRRVAEGALTPERC